MKGEQTETNYLEGKPKNGEYRKDVERNDWDQKTLKFA